MKPQAMVAILRTKSTHLPELVGIGTAQWPKEGWITRSYLHHTLRKKGFHYTAVLNKEIVGSIMVVEEDYPKYWIHYFVVKKNYRRQGVGSALLQRVISHLRTGNFLFVDLEKNDHTGLSFYRKNEFGVMGLVKGWFDGKPGIIKIGRA